MLKILIVTLAFFVVIVVPTTVKRCKNGQPFPLSVDIKGCETPPCDVFKGTTAVMHVHFVGTKNNIKEITTRIRATALGITVPYDLDEDLADVCKNLMYGATCPIDETEDVVYQLNFYVDQFYPDPIQVKVEVSLIDYDKDSIACFSVDIKVKKGPGNTK